MYSENRGRFCWTTSVSYFWDVFLQIANQLIALSNTIENALGTTVLSLCLALIPYYALGLQSILNPTDFSTASRCTINSVAFAVILLTAAEANSKVSLNKRSSRKTNYRWNWASFLYLFPYEMKQVGCEIAARESVVEGIVIVGVGATQERDEHLERMSAVLLLHQRLSSNEFGLHGKAFTITYGLVGNVWYQMRIYDFFLWGVCWF